MLVYGLFFRQVVLTFKSAVQFVLKIVLITWQSFKKSFNFFFDLNDNSKALGEIKLNRSVPDIKQRPIFESQPDVKIYRSFLTIWEIIGKLDTSTTRQANAIKGRVLSSQTIRNRLKEVHLSARSRKRLSTLIIKIVRLTLTKRQLAQINQIQLDKCSFCWEKNNASTPLQSLEPEVVIHLINFLIFFFLHF